MILGVDVISTVFVSLIVLIFLIITKPFRGVNR